MDDDDDDTNNNNDPPTEDTCYRNSRFYDASLKRSNSSPAIHMIINNLDNDVQYDDLDLCASKFRRYSSSFVGSSQYSKIGRLAQIMKNEIGNPIMDEVSQERDLHDNIKMSISFTDLAVGDEQLPPPIAQSIDSRRSSINSSDSSTNYCLPLSPSTPIRTGSIVSNQRQCYSPALQQQVAPFQCYLSSPPSRSQSPIAKSSSSSSSCSLSTHLATFPPNLKRKNCEDRDNACQTNKRTALDKDYLFGEQNTSSPESFSSEHGPLTVPSPLINTINNNNLILSSNSSSFKPVLRRLSNTTSQQTQQQHSTSFNIYTITPSSFPLSSHQQQIDIDLSYSSNHFGSTCSSPTSSTSSSCSFVPISPATTASTYSSCISASSLLVPSAHSFDKHNIHSLVIPSSDSRSTETITSTIRSQQYNYSHSKIKSGSSNQLQRDRSLETDSDSTKATSDTSTTTRKLEPLSVLLPSLDTFEATAVVNDDDGYSSACASPKRSIVDNNVTKYTFQTYSIDSNSPIPSSPTTDNLDLDIAQND